MNDIGLRLERALRQDKRLQAADGSLLHNKAADLLLANDAALWHCIFADEQLRRVFTTSIGSETLWEKERLIAALRANAFMSDSFTAFRNKIGLADREQRLLAQSREVVLTFPYKDAVLEGGQTKADAERQEEAFLHTTLAAGSIDRLLAPKALTNFCRYSAAGAQPLTPEQAQQWTTDRLPNLILRGNNLIGLHTLLPLLAGRIQLIYIDPPYNTGSDSFAYNDNFTHATWLTFMKNRLEAAWQLLAPQGCIFIQTDDNEFAYLKVLCDELFGRENCRETIVLKSSTESGVNAINVKRGERLFKVKEYILFYAKSPAFRFKPFFTKTDFNTNYRYELIEENGQKVLRDLSKTLGKGEALERYALANPENIYSLEKNIKKAGEKFKAFATQNKGKGIAEPYVNSSGETVWVYDGGMLVPLRERIVSENGQNYFGVLASDLWTDIGTTPSTEGGVYFPNGKKPEKLLQRIIEMTTQPGDWVLDYHLGSGTTAAVAHKLGRRYVGIEQLEYGANDAVQRLQQVIQGEQTGISKATGWQGGGEFLYAALAPLNAHWAEKIAAADSDAAVLELAQAVAASDFLDYRCNLAAFRNFGQEFAALSLPQKKQCLLAMQDMNDLYVPLSEIADQTLGISAADRALNRWLYGLRG
ncbi:DNA methyltransferase [Rhodoflexus sp.]